MHYQSIFMQLPLIIFLNKIIELNKIILDIRSFWVNRFIPSLSLSTLLPAHFQIKPQNNCELLYFTLYPLAKKAFFVLIFSS